MKFLLLSLLIVIFVISLAINPILANPISSLDNKAKKAQVNALSSIVSNHNCNIAQINVRLQNTSDFITIYNKSQNCNIVIPPPPPVVCPPGTHLKNGVCIPDVINPPTNTVPKLNTSTTFRIAVVGDIDNNNGLTTQMNLAKKYSVQYLVIPGDYSYSSASGVQDKVKVVFPSGRTIVAVGNHDTCTNVKIWMSVSSCFYQKSASNGKVDFIVIDANSGFDCTGTQFQFVKDKIESSNAAYKVIVIHQPFATVKSQHAPNGKFSCYDSIFQNKVDLVTQAHNHNYQIGKFGSVFYGIFGMGTHDTGSSMYPCSSSSFNGVSMKCITGTNGIEIVDFGLNQTGMKGYFVSNSDKLVETFGGN